MDMGEYPEVVPEWTMGDRLRKARHRTGMSAAEFAEAIGVSPRTVTNAELDKHGVRRPTLVAWSVATGVPLAWLERGDDEGKAAMRDRVLVGA